jgi:mono/diheme cytochrome c family protein
MRKLLKMVGWIVGGLALLVAIGAVTFYTRSNAALRKAYAVTVRPIPIPTDAEAIALGRHLAETRGCAECHGKDFAGGVVIEDGAMGVVHGPNLTRGRGGRAARFIDEDWIRAIRHGVGPDKLGLFIMPSEEYSHFSDADLGALIAYLKSVPAVDRERVPTKLGPVSRVLLGTGKMKLAAETIDHANLRPPVVTPGATVEYGRYVATSCAGCHGPNFSGGKIDVGPPNWPQAANLTPHESGRLAKWTEADFIGTLRTAKRPDGSALDEVMPRTFGNMNDMELKALWLFFRSLPAVPTGAR